MHKTTRQQMSLPSNHTKRSVPPKLSQIRGPWLVDAIGMLQNHWLVVRALDNRGVEYDPIGQFRGEHSQLILYTSRPVPPASTPHSTQANTDDLHTHEMNTRTDFLVARALCLSNPASKGRRWRPDASRAAILRFSQSFLTFVAAQHSLFVHPLHKHNTTQQ